jgi:hypothetical protein
VAGVFKWNVFSRRPVIAGVRLRKAHQMRRDMELVRQIAFAVESASSGIDSESLQIPNYSAEQIAYHCDLMNESGLLDTIDTQTMDSAFATFHIRRLTSKGHDFIDSARNETLWNKAKTTIASTVGGVTIDVLMKYLKSQAMATLGLPE